MTTPDTTSTDESQRCDRFVQCITAFAAAVKNLAIYPANHPRVVERAANFADQHQQLACGDADLTVGQHEFAFDNWPIASEHLAIAWLLRRCRETGIGAIRIESKCRANDLIAFAQALIQCRPRSGTSITDSWQDKTATIRPIALVVSERRRARDKDAARKPTGNTRGKARNQSAKRLLAGHAEATDAVDPTEELPPFAGNASLADKLRAVSSLPSIRELTAAIADADKSEEIEGEQVDLMSAIAEVLPIDCPTDPEGLQATIEGILKNTLQQLHAAARSDSRVRSAHLLRSAIDVAKTYFGRSSTGATCAPQAPSGRPGDEAIQADCEALLAELATLPDASDLRLPPARMLATSSVAAKAELLGICMYNLSTTEATPAQSNHVSTIASLCKPLTSECEAVLDGYLQPGRHSTATRLKLLHVMHEAGQDAWVRNRNYIDDELLRTGFPEVLPIAARVLSDHSDLDRVRKALDDLATVIENGGAEAVANRGLLLDVATVTLLAHCGSRSAVQILAQCDAEEPTVHEALLTCVRGFALPACEHLVVHVCTKEKTPGHYLRRLLHASVDKHIDATTRSISGELLRAFISKHQRSMPMQELGPVIDALRHVPGPATEQFLGELCKLGRLSLRADLRSLRQRAKQTLQAMQHRRSK